MEGQASGAQTYEGLYIPWCPVLMSEALNWVQKNLGYLDQLL